MNEVLEAIKNNKNIKYLFISVPLFSYSCIFETANQTCFNRQLGGAHTHLFTFESLEWISRKYNFELISKWQFGTDILDLFRHICVKLDKNENNLLKEFFMEKFIPIIDDMQMIIDKSNFCSEIHMLLKVN